MEQNTKLRDKPERKLSRTKSQRLRVDELLTTDTNSILKVGERMAYFVDVGGTISTEKKKKKRKINTMYQKKKKFQMN